MTNPEINLIPTATLLKIDSLANIPCRTWGIASESNAAFLLIHGLGGHSGWFEALARRLKVKHFFVMALDLTGFGKRRNDSYISVQQWLKDIKTVWIYLHSIMGDKPVFLLGNSMGALLALKACPDVKPNGLAILSPAFAGHHKIFPLSYQIKGLLKALIMPNKEITLPYGSNLITADEQVKFWLDNNGNCRSAVPGKMLLDLLVLTQSLCLKKIDLPCSLFMITAGMDAIVANKASESVFRQIKAPAKKKMMMHKSMHDLTLDLALDQVADLLIDWSNAIMKDKTRLSGAKSAEAISKSKA